MELLVQPAAFFVEPFFLCLKLRRKGRLDMISIILIMSLCLGPMIKIAATGLIEELPMASWKIHFNQKEIIDSLLLSALIGSIGISLSQKYGLLFYFYKFLFFTVFMTLIGLIDFKTTYVYRSTTLITALGGLLFIGIESFKSQAWPVDDLMGAFIGFSVIGLIVVLTRGMGEGDIEIAALAGLYLGTQGSVITLFFGFVLGGIVGAILLSLKSKGMKDEMAFGPYLVMGSFIAMLMGQNIIEFYLNLIY